MKAKTLTHAVILPLEGRTVIRDGMIVINDSRIAVNADVSRHVFVEPL